MDKTVLIVEDEGRMRHLISDYLKREGLKILEAENGIQALEIFKREKIDLIILDIMMPLMDGYEVCTNIRAHSDVLIIMLTAKSEEDDKLLGYGLGADDYQTKPFSPKVLTAKVKALLKRSELGESKSDNGITRIDTLEINELSHNVSLDGDRIDLSPKEYDLLLYLAKNHGIVLSRDKLLTNVWGYDFDGDLRTVDTHVKRVRQKLGNKADIITTVRGSGYKLEAEFEK
ncbi:MAG: response regulator transcription factor [Clostridiaceae bacterium]|nr:response regulator transcription factor [Clostridiaceae bacterium]